MSTVSLDGLDVMELAELLEFVSAWLASDYERLNVSWQRFIDYPEPGVVDLNQLRRDLDRFVFLLGASDGEALFGPAALTGEG